MSEDELLEQQGFAKLDTEVLVKHRNWKARVLGYGNLAWDLARHDPEDAIYTQFAPHIKALVQDQHAAAQEKALETAYIFIDTAPSSVLEKICAEVVTGIVGKCFAARPKATEKGVDIILLCFEREQQEATLEELIKGFSNKSPKVISGCMRVIRDALRLYGPKIVKLKSVLENIPQFLEHRDKLVRDETRALLVEIHRWTGETVKTHLQNVNPQRMGELEAEFQKHKDVTAVPEKFVRSAVNIGSVATEAGETADMKMLDLIEPHEILKYLNEEFYKELQSKKWQERKEALEALERSSDHPKLADGDYGVIVSELNKIIAKDYSVVVIVLAGKCLTNIANGLRQRFSPFSPSCVSVILKKFKEKKSNVVSAMRDAFDACFLSVTLDDIKEAVLEGLAHKTPSVKSETTLFLTRCFSKFRPEDLSKKLLKIFVEALVKNSNDPDQSVRDSACEALGTAMKVVGENTMDVFLTDGIDELKMKKIHEYYEKAVIMSPIRKKPAAAPKWMPELRKRHAETYQGEKMTEEHQDFSRLDTEVLVKHKNWKARVLGYEILAKDLAMHDPEDAIYQQFAPHIKDLVQDQNAAAQERGLEAANTFIDTAPSSVVNNICAEVVAGIVGKCFAARPKATEKGVDIILLCFEREQQQAALEELIKGFSNKSPKVISGCIRVIRDALRFYGPKIVKLKSVLGNIPPLLEHRNKLVREETRALLVEIHRWIGETVKGHLQNINPQQEGELEAEFQKHKAVTAVPEKFVRSAVDIGSVATETEKEMDEAAYIEMLDLVVPREILKYLNEEFYSKLQSKTWKERKEALEALERLSEHPKLAEGDYGVIVSELNKIIAKDYSVVVIALAGKCLTNIAKGLRQRFSPYSPSCVSVILEKFKEKKLNVVTAMRDAIDACFLSVTLEDIKETVLEGLGHKTPSVKSETTLFLTRCFPKFRPEDLPNKLLKIFSEALIKNSNDPDQSVRDSAFQALGTAMKVVGRKSMGAFLTDGLVELKMKKIHEYCENAVLMAPKRKKPTAAPKCMPEVPKRHAATYQGEKMTEEEQHDLSQLDTQVIVKQKMGELEAVFEKDKDVTAIPEKVVRSAVDIGFLATDATKAADVKMLDSIEPHEILKYLNEEFYDKLRSKKWQEREKALETLELLSRHPKLAPGKYGVIVSELNKIIAKDYSVVVIVLAGKCLTSIAKGLRQRFSPYSPSCVSVILEKFKDKKSNVVTAMRVAIDACILSVSLDAIKKTVLGGLWHHNPSVKFETTLLLTRCFCQCNRRDLPKKLLKYFAQVLIKNSNDADQSVRESAFQALGTAMKVVGKNPINVFFLTDGIAELKMKKIYEYYEKAVITAAKRKKPAAAPP